MMWYKLLFFLPFKILHNLASHTTVAVAPPHVRLEQKPPILWLPAWAAELHRRRTETGR
jgi:hypothetical protein